MIEGLRYHEQAEGWTHEPLGKDCVCFARPAEIGGGYVTIDFQRRVFETGCGKPLRNASTAEYVGKGWKERIVRDALSHLERVMTA